MKIMKKAFYAALLAVILSGCDFTLLPGKVVSLHLSDLSFIPAPAEDGIPLLQTETEEYDVSVSWKKNGGGNAPESFSKGSTYTAEAYLTPKRPFSFDGFSGVFFHRNAETVSQNVSKDLAVVVIGFPPLEQDDADFISLSGTRLKTFLMTPDPSRLEESRTVRLFASDSVAWEIPSQGGGWAYEPFTNWMEITFPLKALFGGSTVYAYGEIFYFTITNGNTNKYYSPFSRDSSSYISISASQPNRYESSVSENFNSGSYILPKTGRYEPDGSVLEFRQGSSFISISASDSKSLSGLTAAGYHHISMTQSFSQTIAYRQQEARDYYLYRSISVSFSPEYPIFGEKGGPLVDRLEYDEESNTLTAYLKTPSNAPGEVFSFYIIADNGSVHKKSVSIGE
jgi:hypothetical protein